MGANASATTIRVNLYTCPNSDQSNRRDKHRRQHTLSARRRPPRPSQPPDANTKRRPSAPPLSGPAICITRSMPPPSVPTVCTTAACPLHRSQQHHRVSVHCTTGTSNIGATEDHHRVQPFCKSSFTLFVPLHRSRCSSLPSAGCQHAPRTWGSREPCKLTCNSRCNVGSQPRLSRHHIGTLDVSMRARAQHDLSCVVLRSHEASCSA